VWGAKKRGDADGFKFHGCIFSLVGFCFLFRNQQSDGGAAPRVAFYFYSGLLAGAAGAAASGLPWAAGMKMDLPVGQNGINSGL